MTNVWNESKERKNKIKYRDSQPEKTEETNKHSVVPSEKSGRKFWFEFRNM